MDEFQTEMTMYLKRYTAISAIDIESSLSV